MLRRLFQVLWVLSAGWILLAVYLLPGDLKRLGLSPWEPLLILFLFFFTFGPAILVGAIQYILRPK